MLSALLILIRMGPHYAHTFFYKYLTELNNHATRVNLKDQSIIIDANSFMYFIYNEILNDDKHKNRNQILTTIPFNYDGYWDYSKQVLNKFKQDCSDVLVVFDGVFKRNANRRPDPERASSLHVTEFNGYQNQLPLLFRRGFIDILRELDIGVNVARGEADPMIVRLAQDRNAYVVAADSDYHLYDLPQGYVPLYFLKLKALKGSLYQLDDVFTGMDAKGVALWASLIKYNFVKLAKLQNFLSRTLADDREKFESWLNSTEPDEQKRNLITTEWLLLRFIQHVGSSIAYTELIELIALDDRQKFDQIRSNYINVIPEASIKTKNGKALPAYLDRLFTTGNLDHTILNILISRNVLKSEQVNNAVYFQILRPIIQILLLSDCSSTELGNDSQKVTFNNQLYEPLAEIKIQDFPSLDEISKMSSADRKKWLVYCVQHALQPSINMNDDEIHDDHLAWMCLLKLWWHKGKEQTLLKKSALYAMIVSYLTHTLLHEHHESERSQRHKKITTISEPFLRYSKRKLKKRFPFDMCSVLSQKISKHGSNHFENENIKGDLHEAEEFYNVFYVAYQLFDSPIIMPKVHEYISTLTYELAIAFTKSNTLTRNIRKRLFNDNLLLMGLFEEIKSWVEQVYQPNLNANESDCK
ncbi:unnamed protein product [Rotaria socialis]|uniref:Asteroid domain-containing protein n=4 Tax=Rotaria socialis TaxID=392032 RepID=A0A820R432_9BILA|nr:unnamed protein product [Rotaria socialis]